MCRKTQIYFYSKCPVSSFAGLVHSSLCACVSAGEVHEEGVLRPAEGCRDGGTLPSTVPFYLFLGIQVSDIGAVLG